MTIEQITKELDALLYEQQMWTTFDKKNYPKIYQELCDRIHYLEQKRNEY